MNLEPNFTKSRTHRSRFALFGLVFDQLEFCDAILGIEKAIEKRERLFISTPNMNWLVTALSDAGLRHSVYESDMVLADGRYLPWLADQMGIPNIQSISGSDLFETLQNKTPRQGKPIDVFFFGGENGAAERASENINSSSQGMTCVGYINPGWGSAKQLSQTAHIEQINASGADFLVVSLGAVKGQEWIQLNKEKLDTPVISHLGAVVNFAGGTVQRAPKAVQDLKLEWLWRVFQEPKLASRYLHDGIQFFGFLKNLRRYRKNLKQHRAKHKPFESVIDKNHHQTVIRLFGSIAESDIEQLITQINSLRELDGVVLDFSEVTHCDPHACAQLLLMRHQANGFIRCEPKRNLAAEMLNMNFV